MNTRRAYVLRTLAFALLLITGFVSLVLTAYAFGYSGLHSPTSSWEPRGEIMPYVPYLIILSIGTLFGAWLIERHDDPDRRRRPTPPSR